LGCFNATINGEKQTAEPIFSREKFLTHSALLKVSFGVPAMSIKLLCSSFLQFIFLILIATKQNIYLVIAF
jgi:hypothetical protein